MLLDTCPCPRHLISASPAAGALRCCRAMTLIEMLVVVAIVAILLAIAVPAMQGARAVGRLTTEQSAARQLMIAYTAYAINNQDRVLTGYAPPDFKAVDAGGQPITMAPARQRYPWRILPYLDHTIEGLFLHEQRDLIEEAKYTQEHDLYIYSASLVPSFGINARWVGGDFSKSATPYACREADCNPKVASDPACPIFCELFGRYWVTRTSEVRRPEQLIVFASARGQEPIPQWGTAIVEGYFKVESPYFTKAQPNWNASFNRHDPPAKFGYISPRHNRRAVIGFMDGRAGILGESELFDMRHWSNDADDHNSHMKPQSP